MNALYLWELPLEVTTSFSIRCVPEQWRVKGSFEELLMLFKDLLFMFGVVGLLYKAKPLRPSEFTNH